MDNVKVPNVTIPLDEYNNLIECRKKYYSLVSIGGGYCNFIKDSEMNITVVINKNKLKELYQDEYGNDFSIKNVLLRR